MAEIKSRINLMETIEVPKAEISKWEGLINSPDPVDFDKLGLAELSTVWCKTFKFSDGFEVDVKVCTDGFEDGTLWSEAVLFDSNGSTYSTTDCSYSIEGEWELEWFDSKNGIMHTYKAVVKGV
jgi:hypothetical protein